MKRIVISQDESGQTVAAVVRRRLGLSWSATKRLISTGRVQVGKQVCADIAHRVRVGQVITVAQEAATEPVRKASKPRGTGVPKTSGPKTAVQPLIHYVDRDIVVVEKPAGLTTMRHREEAEEFGDRASRFLPPTLADLLPGLLLDEEGNNPSPRTVGRSNRVLPTVIAVHRLDKDTSGLVVFARTPAAARHLGQQLREHSMERRYLALVRGRAVDQRIESHFVPDRGDGRRGSGAQPGVGEKAITHVHALEPLGEYTLVECRLETGRTHQVRIHLGEAGTPLCGERVYDRPIHGKPFPDGSAAPRSALHAAVLGLTHPATGQRLRWSAPMPRDLEDLLQRLRAAALDKR